MRIWTKAEIHKKVFFFSGRAWKKKEMSLPQINYETFNFFYYEERQKKDICKALFDLRETKKEKKKEIKQRQRNIILSCHFIR